MLPRLISIPRMKPLAQSLARATPLSSSSSSGENTLPDCKASQVAFQCRVTSEINSCKNWLGLERRLVDHVASPNFREVLARWNVVGTADQGGEEAVQHLKVHRPLVPKVFEYVGKPIELCVGQGLSIYGLLVAVLIALKHPMRRKLFCGPVD